MHLTHVIELFPTPVLFSYYAAGISDAELTFVRSLPLSHNVNNRRSVNSHVLEHAELTALKTFCVDTLQSYVDSVFQPKYPLTVWLTQSWINITAKGEAHHQHNHPNALLSGVLYLATDQDSITFIQPERKLFSIPPEVNNNYNAERCSFKPATNEIIVFPSYLMHRVEQKQNEGERISLAFNAVVKGCIGDEQSLTELLL